jgi:hypothetical protein
MDHSIIDAGNIAERYVTGRLPPEEAAGPRRPSPSSP